MPHVSITQPRARRRPGFLAALVLTLAAVGVLTAGCITNTDPRIEDPGFGSGPGEYPVATPVAS